VQPLREPVQPSEQELLLPVRQQALEQVLLHLLRTTASHPYDLGRHPFL